MASLSPVPSPVPSPARLSASADVLIQRLQRLLPSSPAPVAAGAPAEARDDWEREILEAERRGAEILGPGCETCDAHFGCNCLQERIDHAEAQAREEDRRHRQAIMERYARGECACNLMPEDDWCYICDEAERNRCTGCGGLTSCRPGCRGPEYVDESECYEYAQDDDGDGGDSEEGDGREFRWYG